MFLMSLALLQAATALPDIELSAQVRARSVTIEKRGDASLTVSSSGDGGNLVDVRAPKANGRKTLRNVEVNVRAEARIGQSPRFDAQDETAGPR